MAVNLTGWSTVRTTPTLIVIKLLSDADMHSHTCMQTTIYDVWLPVIFLKERKRLIYVMEECQCEISKSIITWCYRNRPFYKHFFSMESSFLIVSIILDHDWFFSIMIGFSCAYLLRNQHAMAWVTNNNLSFDTCNPPLGKRWRLVHLPITLCARKL